MKVTIKAVAASKDKVPSGKSGGEFDFDLRPDQVKSLIAKWNKANKAKLEVARTEGVDGGQTEAFIIGKKEELRTFAEEHYGDEGEAKELHPSLYKK